MLFSLGGLFLPSGCAAPSQNPMKPKPLRKEKSRSGWVLLLLLILLTGLSLLLIRWYQNEIQFRLQAEAALQFRLIHQQLEGVLAQTVLRLRQHSEAQLRADAFDLSQNEPNAFFADWSIHSRAAKKAPFLKLTLQHESFGEPLAFEALFRFESCTLADIPWWDSSLQPSAQGQPRHLIFSQEQDARLSLQAPRFFLLSEVPKQPFHYILQGNTRLLWTQDRLLVFQGNNVWNLTDFSQKNLRLQIQGDVVIEGSMAWHQDKPIFLHIVGNLSLHLPNQPRGFSPAPPRLFVRVAQTMRIQSQLPMDKTLQINGYFWLEGACPNVSPFVEALYWKGSLACPMHATAPSTVPLHFTHSPPIHAPPEDFRRTAMRFNGIRLLH